MWRDHHEVNKGSSLILLWGLVFYFLLQNFLNKRQIQRTQKEAFLCPCSVIINIRQISCLTHKLLHFLFFHSVIFKANLHRESLQPYLFWYSSLRDLFFLTLLILFSILFSYLKNNNYVSIKYSAGIQISLSHFLGYWWPKIDREPPYLSISKLLPSSPVPCAGSLLWHYKFGLVTTTKFGLPKFQFKNK